MPHLSKPLSFLIFAGVLVSYTVQCELASFLHRSGYSKPYFMLYLTHSSYVIIGLLHYGGLQVLRMPVEPLLAQLQDAVKLQLLGPKPASSTFDSRPFPWHRAGLRLLGLTVFIALPAGIWYSAISLTSMTSLTALYNLNAFWAYILSIYYSKQERWELRSAMSVGIACLGVLVMTYGDSREEAVAAAAVADVQTRSTSPLQAGIVEEGNTRGSVLGDLLGLTSSLACGFYEVWYKRFIALPAATESVPLAKTATRYTALPESQHGENGHSLSRPSKDEDTELFDDIESELAKTQTRHSDRPLQGADAGELAHDESENTSLFLFHANFITMSVGIATIFLLWIPIPILHFMGAEQFGLPRSLGELAAVAGVCFGGVIFNAGFMILLATWGPVVTSVGNLFTLILVAASDEVIALINGYSSLSLSTLAGSGFILIAFGMLVTGPGHGHGHGEAQAQISGQQHRTRRRTSSS